MTFMRQFRTNKFKAKSTEFGGRLYHSKLEASVAADLEIAKKANRDSDRVVEVVPQYPIDIYLDGVTLTTKVTSRRLFRYIIDFYVTFADGHEEFIEAKGMELEVWKFKWKITEAVLAQEKPEAILRVVK